MNTLEDYITQFSSLKTAYSTKGPAPHKALLLLSIIDLIESGQIQSPIIELNDLLINKFKENTRILSSGDDFFKPTIGQPFFFMKSEPFWQLVAKDSSSLSLKTTSYSIFNLRNLFRFALIDTELFVLLTVPSSREKLREVLLNKYIVH